MPDTSGQSVSLRTTAAHGVKWTGTSSLVTTLLGFIQLAILAHVLSRADFGLMAMITAVLGLAQVYADMGVSNAIIYRRDTTGDQLSSLYWLTVFSGVAVFTATVAVSPFVALFYREPGLAGLVRWAAILFLVMPWGQQFQILFQKELRFRTLATIEIISAVAGTCVAVTLAFAHTGVYALVFGQVANASAKSCLLVALGWRRWAPQLHFRRRDLKGYVGFGMFQMGERTLNYFAANLDYLLIGRFLGPTPLGVYSIAYQLVVVPLMRVNPILTRVAFPVFSRRQDDDSALQRGYLELAEVIAFVAFPVLLGLAITAPVAVAVFFGERWQASVPLIQILALMGAVKALGNPFGSLLLAKGRADIGFYWNLFTAALTLVAFWSVVAHGVVYVTWANTLLSLVLFPLSFAILHRLVGLDWRRYGVSLRRPLVISVIMGLGVYAADEILHSRLTSQQLLLSVLVLAGVAIYIGLWVSFGRSFIKGLWTTLMNRVSLA